MSLEHLAFLDVVEFDEGKSLRAAVLLTRADTAPLEFHLTDCVRPTAAQRLLYGAILERHLAVEIFGKPLLSALSQQPEVIITKSSDLFQHLAKSLEIPTVFLTPDKQIHEIVAPQGNPKKALLQALTEIRSREDLLEPFERIRNVVTRVHETNRAGNNKPVPVAQEHAR